MVSCATPRNPDDTINACKLTQPPKEAGLKAAGHLGWSATYPAVIPLGYSGCRKVWLLDFNQDAYELNAIISYKQGLIYKVGLLDEERHLKEVCKFNQSKVLIEGVTEHCLSYDVFENW